MDVSKIRNVPTIFNTDVSTLKEDFVVTGEGEIRPLSPFKKMLCKWFKISDGREPDILGLLLQRLEASSQPNDNAEFLIERDFARIPANADFTKIVKKGFEDLHAKGQLNNHSD